MDAPLEAGGAGASLKKQFHEMVADYVERLIEKGLDNSGFSSEATLRATVDKVVAEIGEDYFKDAMDRLVEQVMRVARHDFLPSTITSMTLVFPLVVGRWGTERNGTAPDAIARMTD